MFTNNKKSPYGDFLFVYKVIKGNSQKLHKNFHKLSEFRGDKEKICESYMPYGE